MNRLLLCVGAAKAGTTWLHKALSRNPGVWAPPIKEPHFFFSKYGWFDRLTPDARRMQRDKEAEIFGAPAGFAPDFEAEWFSRFLTGEADETWYRSLYAAAPAGAWACDFSPSTSLISPEGWRAVAGFAPEVKVIYLMREPRERLWSHIKFHASYVGKGEAFPSLSLEDIHDWIEEANLLEDGRYGTHLHGALKKLPRRDVLAVDFARISVEPDRVLREIEAFVGLPETPADSSAGNRVNRSTRLAAPEGFADRYLDDFRAETVLLRRLGVRFAARWSGLYGGVGARISDGVRSLAPLR